MAVVTRGGYGLHYDVVDIAAPWHENPPTLLLHHGIGATSGIWAEWIAALADRYRIVRFDMRGFGRSGIPATDARWSMDELVADLLAVADASGTARCHVVGESIGGTIGLCAALRHPERLLSLTMSNAAHIGSSIEGVRGWRRLIDEEGMAGWSDRLMAERFHPDALPPDQRAWFARQQASGNADAVMNALSVLIGVDLRPDLAQIRTPVLILHPDGSPFVPVAVAAELAAGLPDAELCVFGHARHGLPLSHGRQCAEVLRRFLDRRFAR